MRKNIKRFALLLAVITLSALNLSCEKDNTKPEKDGPNISNGKGVFILNEGNFGWGNASISYYDKEADTIYHDIYSEANSESLGDVLNSATIYNDHIYMVVNNSGKIVVAKTNTMERTAVIEGLVSPRHLVPVSGGRAFVSDLFGNHIRIIDTENESITGEIPIEGWTEQIAVVNNKLYATAVQANYLYEIDTQAEQLTDSLFLPPGPSALATDKEGKLWVLSGGEAMFKTSASLYRLDTEKLEVIRHIKLPESPMIYFDIAFCPEGETLYILGDNVYSTNAADPAGSVDLFIESPAGFMSSIGIDPYNGDIYIADPVDYEQPGRMLIYDSQGQHKVTHKTGIIPGGFSFY